MSGAVTARCEAVACAFFQSVPEEGDAYLLKLILHDWDDEHAVRTHSHAALGCGERGAAFIATSSSRTKS